MGRNTGTSPCRDSARSGEYLTDRLTDEALRLIDEAGRASVLPLSGPSRAAHPH